MFTVRPRSVSWGSISSLNHDSFAAFSICLWQLLKHGRGLNDFLTQFADEEAFRREVGANGKRPPMDPSWTQGMQNILRSCWAPASGALCVFGSLYEVTFDN
jgi:hypothetical protein